MLNSIFAGDFFFLCRKYYKHFLFYYGIVSNWKQKPIKFKVVEKQLTCQVLKKIPFG